MSDAENLLEIYRRFSELYANAEPIRSPVELDVAIRAAGLDYRQANEEWLKSLDRDWVYHRSEAPFSDEERNRAYRRFLSP